MKKGRIYTNEHGDHGQLTKINDGTRVIVEIVRTLLLLFSYRPVAASRYKF